MIIGIEAMQREDIVNVFDWISLYNAEFIINYIIALALYMLIFSVFNSISVSTAVYTTLLTMFSTINLYKSFLLGEPFYPWDISLYRYVLNLMEELLKEIGYKYILLIVFIPIAIYFATRLVSFELRMKLKSRIPAGILSLCIIALFAFTSRTPIEKILLDANVQRISWEQNLNYEQNGALLGFIMNTEFAFVKAPLGYGEKMVTDAVARIMEAVSEFENDGNFSPLNPDIVVIMNEALWDPINIENAQFSKDPMPLIRKLQSGTLVSSEFGGSTANVEFEFLTGFSNIFLPPGSIAYQQYVYQPIPSIVKRLSQVGYETTAIHPNHKWFYKRDKVYPMLGFNDFYGIESFDDNDIRGAYISDMAVSESIINTIENSDSPKFIFAITMQNHGPYDELRYEFTDDIEQIDIKAPLNDDLLKTLEVFTHGVQDANNGVKRLINYFESSDRPTVFAVFGDHLPFLGTNYGAFYQSGFIETPEINLWTMEDFIKMRSTPLVVWTNFSDEIDEVGQISPAFLGQEILKISGIKMSPFEIFLNILHSKLPVYLQDVLIDAQGNLLKNIPDEMTELLDAYRIVQYDQIFGNQYSKQLFEF